MHIRKRILGFWRRFFPPKEQAEFSIGIYKGKNPFELSSISDEPVLTKDDITDKEASYVADPFMIKKDNIWYMFFEVKLKNSYKTELAYATSKEGLNWKYEKTISINPLFRSYPYVFEDDGKYYLVPESAPLKSVILYSAEEFPEKWKPLTTIASGKEYVDPTIFKHNNLWWAFLSTTDNSKMYLFYSKNLEGPWTEHPNNPVIKKNLSSARPGGKIIKYKGHIYRMAQDCSEYYGKNVTAFRIKRLNEKEYEEEEIGVILKPGNFYWNSHGMHTLDLHETNDGWIACVDGYTKRPVYGK